MEEPLIAAVVMGSVVAVMVGTLKIITDTYLKRKLIHADSPDSLARAVLKPGGSPNVFTALKWGLVVTALGASLILIDFLPFTFSDPFVYGLMFVFAGGGLIGYYVLAKGLLRRENDLSSSPFDEPFEEDL